MPTRVALLMVVSLVAGGHVREAQAQHFGRNKVEYVDFDFKVLETEHFSVYYYSSEEPAARIAARLAERWHARLSRALEHDLQGRQPLILYGSQPEFAQTNVVNGFIGEGIGGVTELARRRIVMPFAPTLGETDRILGHELTHAFQFDMARRYRGGLTWPLWAVEGLAQYLALGARDVETAMWLRDAVRSDLLPVREQDAARKFSPYRYGHALWAYLAGRFGDNVVPAILKAREAGSLERRIKAATGLELQTIYAEWRTAAVAQYAIGASDGKHARAPQAFSAESTGRLLLGPSVSPDGRQAVFFSERDRLSLDLYLANTDSGTITRKLATTAAAARVESLQAVRSAGAWSPEGDRFAYAAVERGQPALVVLDMGRPGRQQTIALPQFGQIFTPAWSPDGRAIAFSALQGGATDIHVYDLGSGALTRLTADAFGDLHPEWSPDGRQLIVATERFSSDTGTLEFGACGLAVIDVRSGEIRPLPAFEGARHVNPQWSPDGSSVYFVADPHGISNVYRLDLASAGLTQITDVDGGVAGLTPTSPALSVARSASLLAFTVYRGGRYAIEVRRGPAIDAGTEPRGDPTSAASALPPTARATGIVEQVLDDAAVGLPQEVAAEARAYAPDLFLEALGPPHVSSGGGPFGTFVRGGGSVLFSDLLGERKLAVFAQAGNRLRDLAVRVQFLNRERRWNWGALAEIEPSLRRLPRSWSHEVDGGPARTMETHFFERTQARVAGLLAYPLDRAQRLEFELGARHTAYRRSVSSVIRSLSTGRVLERATTDQSGGRPATVGEVSAAYVRDTAVLSPTSPILGERTRIESTSTFGELSVARVLVDHRRYFMPVKPYTLAIRGVHIGQYGPDAADPRMLPTFLGSRQFLRGYGWGSIRCNTTGACGGFDELLGSRLLVGNVELRAPILGLRARELRYSPIPLEAFAFADAGLVWARSPEFSAASGDRRLVRSFGAGVRVNAFGFPLQIGAVRAVDPPSRAWSFDLSFQTGF
jgi:Tol biopolymer transport system component